MSAALGNRCPQCGAALDPASAEGLCPRCLVAMNLGVETEVPQGEVPSEPKGGGGARPATPSPAEIAPHFPQLEIVECLGRGGMGVVYKARQPHLDRLVALKILAPEKEKEAAFAERFAREAQTLARLSHQNIVTIYDFGKVDGLYYLLMEYVNGVSLRQLLQARTITPEEALAIVPRICEALQYAHEHGVVHRDIKPENVLLNQEGLVKIADFGIAKVTGTASDQAKITEGQVIGTAAYMAPEQLEHPQTVDRRADIYSLGVVFYEMLTGELPLGKFAAPSCKAPIDLRLDGVVLKALEKTPERRYQQASALKTDVETIASSSGSGTGAAANKARASRRGRQAASYALAGLCLCLLFGLAAFWRHPATGDAAEFCREGWGLWQSGEVEQARTKFNQAIKLAPGSIDPWNGLGWSNLRAGNHPAAEKAFQKALSLEPDYGSALNGLGMVYFVQKKFQLAETNLLLAARTAPAAHYGLASLYLLEGNFEQAEKWARSAIDFGEGDELVRQVLQAAQEKSVSDELRKMLQP